MKRCELMLVALVLAVSSTAHAHLRVMSHPARHGSNQQKVGPCGSANSMRGTNIQTFEPGETITLEVDEYIAHPGYFRIAFDVDGQDDLLPPTSIDPPKSEDNGTVLMDVLDMHQRGGGKRSWKVKLPDEECDDCTLQVIQVMLDKLPYDPQDNGALSNDIYYACIDVVLKRKAGGGAATDAAVADAGPLTRDAGAPRADAGDEKPDPRPEESAPMARDAGGSKRDAASGTAPSRDAAPGDDEHADHEADDDHDASDDDSAADDSVDDGEDDDSASDASRPDDRGCALTSARPSHVGDFAIALAVFTLALRRSQRRRRAS